MSTYDTLRSFADSYFLIFMFALFAALCLWPFRPGSGEQVEKARTSIFENDHDG